MHNTILDLQHIMNTQKKPSIIHLTETKHSHIKSIWREELKYYKLVHTRPTLEPNTNIRSGGTILAVRRDTYKEVTAIPTPSHIGDYISAATLTPYDGSPIIAISAYMPQLHTEAKDTIYTEILAWIHMEIMSKFLMVTALMSGDLQSTPTEEDKRSYHVPLNHFCKESGLIHITPSDIYTYIPAKTSIDHWLMRQPNATTHYTKINTKISTHTSKYGDHKALILKLPQIGSIATPDIKHKHMNPTTRSHPHFLLPILCNRIDIYQLGKPSTSTSTQDTSQTLNNLFMAHTAIIDQIYYTAAQVMKQIH